jgi:hypothetical protein
MNSCIDVGAVVCIPLSPTMLLSGSLVAVQIRLRVRAIRLARQ